MKPDPLFERMLHMQKEITSLRLQHWIRFEVLTPQWWLLVGTLLVPWFVWTRFVDRKRLIEILLYGVIAAFVITMLDATGSDLELWAYVYKSVPLYNRCFVVDAGALPVIFMVVYQYCNTWSRFLIVHTGVAAVCAFILEPLAHSFGIYVPLHWKYIYSFPLYILLPVCLRSLMVYIKSHTIATPHK